MGTAPLCSSSVSWGGSLRSGGALPQWPCVGFSTGWLGLLRIMAAQSKASVLSPQANSRHSQSLRSQSLENDTSFPDVVQAVRKPKELTWERRRSHHVRRGGSNTGACVLKLPYLRLLEERVLPGGQCVGRSFIELSKVTVTGFGQPLVQSLP